MKTRRRLARRALGEPVRRRRAPCELDSQLDGGERVRASRARYLPRTAAVFREIGVFFFFFFSRNPGDGTSAIYAIVGLSKDASRQAQVAAVGGGHRGARRVHVRGARHPPPARKNAEKTKRKIEKKSKIRISKKINNILKVSIFKKFRISKFSKCFEKINF